MAAGARKPPVVGRRLSGSLTRQQGFQNSAAPRIPQRRTACRASISPAVCCREWRARRAPGAVLMRRLDFDAINRAALASLPALLRRWLPDGRLVGHEFEARNPRRADRHPGRGAP